MVEFNEIYNAYNYILYVKNFIRNYSEVDISEELYDMLMDNEGDYKAISEIIKKQDNKTFERLKSIGCITREGELRPLAWSIIKSRRDFSADSLISGFVREYPKTTAFKSKVQAALAGEVEKTDMGYTLYKDRDSSIMVKVFDSSSDFIQSTTELLNYYIEKIENAQGQIYTFMTPLIYAGMYNRKHIQVVPYMYEQDGSATPTKDKLEKDMELLGRIQFCLDKIRWGYMDLNVSRLKNGLVILPSDTLYMMALGFEGSAYNSRTGVQNVKWRG